MDTKLIWPPVVDPALLEREWTWTQLDAAMGRGVFEAPQLFELIGGRIRFKARKSPLYAGAVCLAVEQMRLFTIPNGHWRTQTPLELGERDVLDPVLALVEGEVRDYFQHHPRRARWVIEIADRDLDFQREVKRPLYAQSVSEHWLVDLNTRTVEVSTLPQLNSYSQTQIYSEHDRVSPPSAPQNSFLVAEILP